MLIELPQAIVAGLVLGSIYSLTALGFVTIYNVTNVINFAQGEFVMLGAMFTVMFSAHIPLWMAIIAAIILTAVIGSLGHRLALRPGVPEISQIIITIGLSIALRGAALLAWGTFPLSLPPFSEGADFIIGGVVISRQALWVFTFTALTLLVLGFFFSRTVYGRALRACAVNRTAARLVGISPQLMGSLAFALGAGVAAIAGAVITPITYATYDMGAMLGLKGFVAAVVGGLVKPTGAVAGGFLLGILEALAGSVNSALTDIVSFTVLLIVLLSTRVKSVGLGEREMNVGGH